MLKRAVHDLIDYYLDEPRGRRIAPSLIALLVGGRAGNTFQHVLEDLVSFLGSLKGRVRVVVESSHLADELLCKLLNRLKSELPTGLDFICYAVSAPLSSFEAAPVHECIKKWIARLSKDADYLLQIAAIFGSDFRWTWLRDCWSSLHDNSPQAHASFRHRHGGMPEQRNLAVRRFVDRQQRRHEVPSTNEMGPTRSA